MRILELSDTYYKITTMNLLKNIHRKVDIINKVMDNFGIGIKIPKAKGNSNGKIQYLK